MSICQICLKEKRLKFSTNRLCICKECLFMLYGQKFSECDTKSYLVDMVNNSIPMPSDSDIYYELESLLMPKKKSFLAEMVAIFAPQKNDPAFETKFSILKEKMIKDTEEKRIRAFADAIEGRYIPSKEFFKKIKKNNLYNDNDVDYELRFKFLLKIYRAYKLKIISGFHNERLSVEDWNMLRAQVIACDKKKCNLCNSIDSREYHLHHIVPLYAWGTNHINNLVFLCQKCHQKQHKSFVVSKNKK